MAEIIKRKLHCSFCNEIGHAINNCNDPQIEILLQQFYEYISLDIKCNFKKKYVKYNMSLMNISEIKILGYNSGISMNKQSREEFTMNLLDEYYTTQNDVIINTFFNNMNISELACFAENIATSSTLWNSRKISLKRVESMLGITNNNNPIRNKKVSSKLIGKVSEPTDVSTVSVYNNTEITDDSDNIHYYDIQYFMLPVITPDMLNELTPFVQKSIQCIYMLSAILFIMNFYILHVGI